MKLVALNKGLDKYGYADEMEWKSEGFHGHQKGIILAEVKRPEAGEKLTKDDIIQNFLPVADAEKDKHLLDIINNPDIILVGIVQSGIDRFSGNDVSSEYLYLPYGVDGHSIFEPTVNFENVDDNSPHKQEMDIEICFVVDGYNRYVILHRETYFLSVMRIVTEFLDDIEDMQSVSLETIKQSDKYTDILEELDSYFQDKDEYDDGIYMDFYDEAGNIVPINIYKTDMFTACVSMRLIKLITHIRIPDEED